MAGLLLFLSACGPEVAAGGKQVHPTRENLPEGAELAAWVRMEDEGGPPEELRGILEQLGSAREVLKLGVLEGPEHQVFGSVEDIEGDAQGSFAVLDSRFNQVRVYGSDGAISERFGAPGRGPNEFLAPEALERDRTGLFIVADRNNQLKIFERTDGVVTQRSTIQLDFAPEDFCLLGDRVYVQAYRPGQGVVHAFSLAGERLHSFGEPYRSPNALVSSQLSDGRIACSEDAQTVVTLFEHVPVVHGYSPDGTLRWRSRLGDFVPMTIVEGQEPDGRPSIEYLTADAEFDVAEAVTAVPDGMVMVQTAHHNPASRAEGRDYSELRTYVLSARTGQGAYVGSHLPRIYDVEGSRLFGATNDPFPQVMVYELRTGGRGR
ncbi:MAG TPA: hypothetical protein VHG51_20070 [Longimicrobiaceae bacterium]|nr:hypothetical protein [Longimicrobiaceae bacterium]